MEEYPEFRAGVIVTLYTEAANLTCAMAKLENALVSMDEAADKLDVRFEYEMEDIEELDADGEPVEVGGVGP